MCNTIRKSDINKKYRLDNMYILGHIYESKSRARCKCKAA